MNAKITRTFHAYVEMWEKDAIRKNDVVAERKLLEKYKGLQFISSYDYKVQTICGDNLEWRRRMRNDDKDIYTGWFLKSMSEDGEEEIWQITDDI